MGNSAPTPKKDFSDKVVDTILNSEGECKIVGSYVYKKKIIGEEKVGDIDCVCKKWLVALDELRKYYAVNPTVSYDDPYEPFNDYTRVDVIKCDRTESVKVDLISKDEYDKLKHNSFINNVQWGKNGLEHKEGNDKQMKWIIENLRNCKICKWADMREKDKEYFEKFTKIPWEECQENGL